MYTKTMILLTHILIALGSVAWSLYTYLSPTQAKLRGSSYLITATLISGTILVINTNAPLVKSCVTGLIFVAASMAATVAARHKLAKIMQPID